MEPMGILRVNWVLSKVQSSGSFHIFWFPALRCVVDVLHDPMTALNRKTGNPKQIKAIDEKKYQELS